MAGYDGNELTHRFIKRNFRYGVINNPLLSRINPEVEWHEQFQAVFVIALANVQPNLHPLDKHYEFLEQKPFQLTFGFPCIHERSIASAKPDQRRSPEVLHSKFERGIVCRTENTNLI